ncbi:Arabinose efflux permease [Sesbania bispinosa]|nr:Arabinose efflux permease [Sesbania bispinosa]
MSSGLITRIVPSLDGWDRAWGRGELIQRRRSVLGRVKRWQADCAFSGLLGSHLGTRKLIQQCVGLGRVKRWHTDFASSQRCRSLQRGARFISQLVLRLVGCALTSRRLGDI